MLGVFSPNIERSVGSGSLFVFLEVFSDFVGLPSRTGASWKEGKVLEAMAIYYIYKIYYRNHKVANINVMVNIEASCSEATHRNPTQENNGDTWITS